MIDETGRDGVINRSAMAATPTPEQMNAINEAIFAGRKIEAIKLYRSATGHDLKDSKEFVEKLAAELYQQHPERFSVSPLESSATTIRIGFVIAIVVAIVIVILLILR